MSQNTSAIFQISKHIRSKNINRFRFFYRHLHPDQVVDPDPGVDFTNILRKAYTHADPKSTKNTLKQSVLFALLGSARVKAWHKMLVKSAPAFGPQQDHCDPGGCQGLQYTGCAKI